MKIFRITDDLTTPPSYIIENNSVKAIMKHCKYWKEKQNKDVSPEDIICVEYLGDAIGYDDE